VCRTILHTVRDDFAKYANRVDIETMAAMGTTVRYRLLSLPADAVAYLTKLSRERDAEGQAS
jgi:hypothetical protein